MNKTIFFIFLNGELNEDDPQPEGMRVDQMRPLRLGWLLVRISRTCLFTFFSLQTTREMFSFQNNDVF